jgi:hypothetical protein
VIYEMTTGCELSRLVPTELDYSYIEHAGCRRVLKYIFSRSKGRFRRGITKVLREERRGGGKGEREGGAGRERGGGKGGEGRGGGGN